MNNSLRRIGLLFRKHYAETGSRYLCAFAAAFALCMFFHWLDSPERGAGTIAQGVLHILNIAVTITFVYLGCRPFFGPSAAEYAALPASKAEKFAFVWLNSLAAPAAAVALLLATVPLADLFGWSTTAWTTAEIFTTAAPPLLLQPIALLAGCATRDRFLRDGLLAYGALVLYVLLLAGTAWAIASFRVGESPFGISSVSLNGDGAALSIAASTEHVRLSAAYIPANFGLSYLWFPVLWCTAWLRFRDRELK